MCCFFVITTIIEIVYYNGQNKKKPSGSFSQLSGNEYEIEYIFFY